jgi:AraC-like DNA-binding protein
MKLDILDSLEILSFQNQQSEYPIHYHETFCISLIEKGVFSENELIVPSGSILLSHPNEIHYNKPIDNIDVSFSTFYVSQDVINFISPYECTSFQNKIIDNQVLYNQFEGLMKFSKASNDNNDLFINFSYEFKKIMFQLTSIYGDLYPQVLKSNSLLLSDVKRYVNDHLNLKIDLNVMSEKFKMNNFQFIRWFKKNIGMTPFQYIMLKRVGSGKKLIQQGVPLVDAALDSGFYDQSHFSNYFKKYVGMSPNVYKQNCNMFQDY